MELVLNINNKNVTVNVPTDEMLLDTLRNLGYYSVRCGCDTTNCGLCTVWVDDEIILSCAYPTFRAPGHKITTLEGLQEEAELLAACIASEGADQCGFCTTSLWIFTFQVDSTHHHASCTEAALVSAFASNTSR